MMLRSPIQPVLRSPLGSPLERRASVNSSGLSPSRLFASGEQGVWYDPSDMSTMFQDSAGTTPVTAVEQPVGRILDKSGRGNHAFQTTTTSRPVLSARVNLLTKTEQFDDPVWVTSGRAKIDANNITAPNGTLTADRITETVDNGTHRVSQLAVPSAGNFTFFVNWKKGTRKWVWISINNTSNYVIQFFDLDNATLGASDTIGSGIVRMSAAITPEPNGFFRCALTVSSAYTSHDIFTGLAATNGINAYSGSTSEYGYIWGADLRVANTGVNLPAYQRVNTSTDYDTTGFPHYLRFDGVDDFLVTPSINFTSTDKVTVFAGVRKLSDASGQVCFELGTDTNSVNGSFGFFTPGVSGEPNYIFASRGTDRRAAAALGYSAPITNVITGSAGISVDLVSLRVNAVQAAQDTFDQGTGNYGNYPLYIGRRGGTTLPFNGHLYSLIVRGAQSTAQQIAQTEQWVNGKTKAY